jgi:carboxyl-terminal processing protease
MTGAAHGFPGAVRILAAALTLAVAHGQEKPADDPQAAERLWASFLAKYEEKSLQPLAAAELDEKARVALLAASGPRFSAIKADSVKSLPELAVAMTARDGSVDSFSRVEKALEEVMPEVDRYGGYSPAADVALLREALRQNSGIVHMTLDQRPDGRVLCYPLDGGPADEAGVNHGAELLGLDGRAVAGKSLLSLRLAFVGPAGTIIRVKVRQPQGLEEEFAIKRNDVPIPVVRVEPSIGGLTVRIRKFNNGSAASLKKQLEATSKPGNITLDLRGNSGGLRDEALKMASLFFPEGTVLGKFTTRDGAMEPKDGNGVFVEPGSIRILQDERTASAAEYLIAILKEGLPGKVTTFGTRSYGKSHTVLQTPLQGGGELTVTEALMAMPSGKSWDETGLEPDRKAD